MQYKFNNPLDKTIKILNDNKDMDTKRIFYNKNVLIIHIDKDFTSFISYASNQILLSASMYTIKGIKYLEHVLKNNHKFASNKYHENYYIYIDELINDFNKVNINNYDHILFITPKNVDVEYINKLIEEKLHLKAIDYIYN